MKFSTFALFLLAALPPASLAAQGQDQYAWGLGGGATLTSSVARDNHPRGVHGLVMIGIGSVDSPFGVRLDGMYTHLTDADSSAAVATDQGSARVTSIMANILFNVYGSAKRLYVIGGIGGFGYNPSGPGTSAVTDFGVNAGLGIWVPTFNGFIEARWFNLYRALPDPVTGLKGKKSARLYPVTLGIMF